MLCAIANNALGQDNVNPACPHRRSGRSIAGREGQSSTLSGPHERELTGRYQVRKFSTQAEQQASLGSFKPHLCELSNRRSCIGPAGHWQRPCASNSARPEAVCRAASMFASRSGTLRSSRTARLVVGERAEALARDDAFRCGAWHAAFERQVVPTVAQARRGPSGFFSA
jgi:hypothetical protein